LETDTEKPVHETLSDREYHVMLMIASGKTVKQVADKLSLSVKTISTYRARTLIKMGMKNNAEITYYAIKNALVAPTSHLCRTNTDTKRAENPAKERDSVRFTFRINPNNMTCKAYGWG